MLPCAPDPVHNEVLSIATGGGHFLCDLTLSQTPKDSKRPLSPPLKDGKVSAWPRLSPASSCLMSYMPHPKVLLQNAAADLSALLLQVVTQPNRVPGPLRAGIEASWAVPSS